MIPPKYILIYLAQPNDLFTASCHPANNSSLFSSSIAGLNFLETAQFLETSSLFDQYPTARPAK